MVAIVSPVEPAANAPKADAIRKAAAATPVKIIRMVLFLIGGGWAIWGSSPSFAFMKSQDP